MKTLYEKFCFLNGFLEQKLDDPDNLKLLKLKGFKIEKKQDAQTESYVRVLLNGMLPKLAQIPKDKTTLALFIETCCRTSNFEEDNVVVATFNENYQEFCTLNHLQFEAPSAAELQKNYNIESKYIPQQWVERDEQELPKHDEEPSMSQKVADWVNDCVKKCMPEQETYIINRQKMQNHFSLIMNHPEKIKTQAELAQANTELILFGGWYLVDFITVLAHFITTIILILPLFGFTLLEKILYAQYSLIPYEYLITLEDITQNYWLLPIKLYNESSWIKNILIIVAIYWVYSITDLIYYYISMEFPQENFFKKVQPRTANRIQLIFRQVMWTLVLYSAYQLCIFLTLALVWLLLGAIVNPTAFLPYATAAATFVAVVSTKASQFQEIATDGFATVIEYVEKIAQQQMGSLLKQIDLKGKVAAVTDSESFKSIAGQAASLGLVDKSTLEHLEQNADQMLSNPEKALETAAGELQEIAANPGAFVAKMMKQLEEKATAMIKEQMVKQIDGFGEQIANIVLALFKKDQNLFKNNVSQLMYAAAKAKNLTSLLKMGQPIMNFVWEFAYPNSNQKNATKDDFVDQMLGPCTDCIAGLVAQETETILKDIGNFDPKVLQIILKKAIALEKNLEKENLGAVLEDFEEIIFSLKDKPQFTQIKLISKYAGLLKIAMSLFEGRKGGKLTFHKIFHIIVGFFDQIPQLKQMKDLLGIVELLVNSFNKQTKALPTKMIRQRVDKGLNVIKQFASEKGIQLSPEQQLFFNTSYITQLFNFMSHNFEKIPKDQLKEVFHISFSKKHECFDLADIVQSEKEYKKLVMLMTHVFEMVGLFMEDTKELTQNLHKAAVAFAINPQKAQHIQTVVSIKYVKHTTYEGSEAEDDLFSSLSSNPLINNICLKLRVDSRIVRGLIAHFMSLPNRYGVQELYMAIAKLNKIDKHRINQFFHILQLFKSNNESHLVNSAVYLQIPREYITLILLSKKVLEPQFIDKEQYVQLGAQEETLRMLIAQEFDFSLFLQQLKKDVTEEDDNLVPGGNSKLLKQFLLETISDSATQITENKVQTILMSLGNNLNEFAKLSQNEIDLLTKILQLKTIDLMQAQTALSSDTKQGLYIFAQLLNINKTYFEDLINIAFLNNSDRVVQSIINVQGDKDPFILEKDIKDYQEYLEFMFSKMEMIQKKHDFLIHKFSKMFPTIRLPKSIIVKLLLNKEQSIDINSFYQLAYLIIERDENGLLPKGTLKQLNKSISFLTSTLSSHDLAGLKQSLQKDDMTDGQGVIIQMLNENSKKRAISLFLDFLYDNSKRSKNDDVRDLPQVFHLFSCLYLYMTGQAQDIIIKVEQNQQIVETSIINYLCKKLDLKQEFFEALFTFYMQDNQKFTQIMVKFMRRLQACKFEQENPGVKIPLQSLVKIPDQLVLNFINLITGKGYQTSFFAKELGIDNDIVLFISILMEIQRCQTQKDRSVQYQYLVSNSQKIGPLLNKVQVVGDELVLILNLMYQDYETAKVQYLIDGLKLSSKLQAGNLGALLQVDCMINYKLKKIEYYKRLEGQILENTLIKNMNVDPGIVIMTKSLSRGGFGCLEDLFKLMPHLDYAEGPGRGDYICLLQGLIGSVSGVMPQNFDITKFLRDMYKNLNVETENTDAFQDGTNDITFAYFQLARVININPVILMLSQGLLHAWVMLKNNYYVIQNEENKWVHPALVLEMFLLFQSIPTLIKEVLAEMEFLRQTAEVIVLTEEAYENGQLPALLTYFNNFFEPFDYVDEIYKDVQAMIFSEQITSEQGFLDIAETIGFNQKVVELLDLADEDIVAAHQAILSDSVELFGFENNEEFKQDMDELATILRNSPDTMTYEQAVNQYRFEQDERLRLKSLKPLIQGRAIIKVYSEVCKLFVDPRIEQGRRKKQISELFLSSQYPDQEIPLFTLGVCTTLTQLRNSYWNCPEGIVPRDEDHYKIAAHQIDFVLTSIERLFFFKNFTDSYAKPKAATTLGLATGFAFTAEHFISANCTRSIFQYKQTDQIYGINHDEGKKDEAKYTEKIQMKFDMINEFLCNRSTIRDDKCFKAYKREKIKKFGMDIISEPENYLEISIQQTLKNKEDQGFDCLDYYFDIPFVQDGSSYAALARILGEERYQGIRPRNREAILKVLMEELGQRQVEEQYQKQMKLWDQQQQNPDLKLQKAQSSKQPEQEEPRLDNVIDVRSGKLWTQVIQSQQRWAQICYQKGDTFKLLIDIFKGNYMAICEPDTYFTDEEPAAAMAYSGMLALSGAAYKVQNGWNQNTSNHLSKYLNNCCWNTLSNKKNLQEILSIFFNCFDGLNILGQTLQQDIKIINSFTTLSCSLSSNETAKYDHLDTLIEEMSLSENDSEVLKNLIRAYLGEVDQYYALAKFSTVFSPLMKKKTAPVEVGKLITNKRKPKTSQLQDELLKMDQEKNKKNEDGQVTEQHEEPDQAQGGEEQKQIQQQQQEQPSQVQQQDQPFQQSPLDPNAVLQIPQVPRPLKLGAKKEPEKKGKQDEKKGKQDDKKGKPQKPRKKKGMAQDLGGQGDIYFSTAKILNKLLYGFDISQLHSQQQINQETFNFCDYSALSLNPDKTEEQFIIILWQLAQAVTKDTLPENYKLPVISESELATNNKNSMEFQEKYQLIWKCCQFISEIIKEDYSSFFQNPEEVQGILTQFSIIRQDYPIEDLNFLKAMIGLKSSKMQLIQMKRKKNIDQKKESDVSGLDIQEQVENLYQSKIVDIHVEGQKKEFNEKISKNIAQLFLALSSNNINKIVDSFIEHDGMSACFVLTLYLWKHMTYILSNQDLIKDSIEGVYPAIQLLPLLVFSQINEQQDKVKGAPRNNKRQKIMGAFSKIIQFIVESKPTEKFYNQLEQLDYKSKKLKKPFQWSQWLIYMPSFIDKFQQFARSQGLQAFQESIFLFKVITGYHYFDKAQQIKIIGPLSKLYLHSSRLILYPQTFQNEKDKVNLQNLIPNSMTSLNEFLPDELNKFVVIFDKFIQLFIFVQIPPQSMKILQNYSKQMEAEIDEDEDDDDQSQSQSNEDESKSQNEVVEVAIKQSEQAVINEMEEIFTQFILDVLGQTVINLQSSFREENRRELSQKAEALNKEIAENKKKLEIQTKLQQGRSGTYISPSPLLPSPMKGIGAPPPPPPPPGAIGGSQIGMQMQGQMVQGQMVQGQVQMPGQMMGQMMQGQPGQMMGQMPGQLGQMGGQIGQMTSQIGGQVAQLISQFGGQAGSQIGFQTQQVQVPVVFDFAAKQAELELVTQQIRTQDQSSKEVSNLINGIIALLTGYNIGAKTVPIDKEQKKNILCFIVDSVLFKNMNLLQYINTQVIRELYLDIMTITNQPLKQITNPEFLSSILVLMYTVTGQEPSEQIKEKKKQIKQIKKAKGDQWYFQLPKRVQIVELPMGMIEGIFNLSCGRMEAITPLLKELQVGEGAVKIVDNVIKQVRDMNVFGGKPPAIGGGKGSSKRDKEIQDLMKKIEEGSASPEDMFKAIDEDGTNSISKTEYGILARRLGMNLSEHRINEIFANIKKSKNPQDKDNELNQKEFAKAMEYLQQKNTDMALDFLGISPALLTMALIMLAIILLLIFVFIFLGIQAFALGGTFGAVINSMLPMAAGGGAGGKADKVGKGKQDTSIGDSVDKTQKIIQSDEI